MNAILKSMFDCIAQGNKTYLPSKFWEALNEKNTNQLESDGMKNFKRTIAQNYFTWVVGRRNRQFRYLVKNTNFSAWPSILSGLLTYDRTSPLGKKQQKELDIFTRMLWRLAERNDAEGLLERIDEPAEGNPFKIYSKRKLISQDLANSILEYYSIREGFTVSNSEKVTICELGAGYGRNAYVFLKAFQKCKYIIVDIPPALHVAQHYLTSVFRDKRIFTFRCFDNFSDVEKEFNESDVAFLLPHQAELLPGKSVDLFINISSLGEMKTDQIHAYFKLIDNLTRGFFYTKQWRVSSNYDDGIIVAAKDYPVPARWQELYHRNAKVQTDFFEAMYALGERGVR
jgi:putative sugar O-methyltransferase